MYRSKSTRNGGSAIVFLQLFLLLTGFLFPVFAHSAEPSLNTPAAGSTLSASSQVFSWAANNSNVVDWWLYVGSTVGGLQYYNSHSLGAATTSVSVSGLPDDGSALQVRLWYKVGTVWDFVDNTFTAYAAPSPALIQPLAGAVLAGNSQLFQWADNGTSVDKWWLYAGTSAGGKQLYDSGSLASSVQSLAVNNLPTDGSMVHIRLWYKQQANWHHQDYTFSAQSVEPALTLPVSGSTLAGSSAVFVWEPNGFSPLAWWLSIGTSAGASNLFNTGSLSPSTLTVTADGLPANGTIVHVRLWYRMASGWKSVDYSFTNEMAEKPALIAPQNNATLSSTSQLFAWSNRQTDVKKWWLYVGTSIGGSQLFDSGSLAAKASTVTVEGLPANGSSIYSRLWYKTASSGWLFVDSVQASTAQGAFNLGDYSLVFSDNFNGNSLNPAKWNTGLLWGPYVPINNEQQLYVDTLGMHQNFSHSPFSFTGTSLKITATETSTTLTPPPRPAESDPVWQQYGEYRFNGPYTDSGGTSHPGYQEQDVDYLSGIITSYDSFKMTHGYVETRAKVPEGKGLWPAFWMLTSHYVEDVPEIDVMEFLGDDVDTIYHTYHYFEPKNNWRAVSTPSFTSNGTDWTAGFHTFGMAWSPRDIVWYVDGVEVHRVNDADYKISGQAMYLLANLAVGGNWPGSPDASTVFPASYEIDYIRAYKKDLDNTLDLTSDYQLMFADEFNGNALDPDKWNTAFLWGPYLPINDEKQYYVDSLGADSGKGYSPFSFSDGIMSITARAGAGSSSTLPPAALPGVNDPTWTAYPTYQQNQAYTEQTYTSGIMTSYDSFKFANGYAEIRAKIPDVDGLWPAFWLLNGYYIAQQPEIDIMEALTEQPTKLYHTYHLNNGTMQVTQGQTFDNSSAAGFADGFHTYGVRWQPGKIVWYVDGVEAHSYTNDNVAYQLMYVIANLAVEGSFNHAPLDVAGLPASMDIDYIRVYQERD